LLYFAVGYDEEVVVEPDETEVVPWGYIYVEVDEQKAITAVIESNGSMRGHGGTV
jgi:hypothetical protein